MKEFLARSLGPKFSERLVSPEQLVIEYLDTRLPEEEELFREAAQVTRKIWEEAFSNKVIQPGRPLWPMIR